MTLLVVPASFAKTPRLLDAQSSSASGILSAALIRDDPIATLPSPARPIPSTAARTPSSPAAAVSRTPDTRARRERKPRNRVRTKNQKYFA
jgi:hypothetical protein